ncbi:MAG: corrinoid protein [Syntrophales bacterium]|jgi:5-methyltetrahydrofolate--homocysteine methyltransferase|nr:corrinoid protein [Syntrophales bacterium]
MTDHLSIIKNAVIEGKYKEIQALTQQALEAGLTPRAIIDDALIAAMDVVGDAFGSGEIFIPEMLASAITMKSGLSIIKPLLTGDQTKSRGTVVMATIKGDLHDIGKNLVCMLLEGAGFNVVDLGTDVDIDEILNKVKEIKPPVLGLSALLTTSMPEMRRVIEALEAQGLRKNLKVIVGGAPIDRAFAEKIGADASGANATEAVELARRFTDQ